MNENPMDPLVLSCEIESLRSKLAAAVQYKDAHLDAMCHLVERTRERDAMLLQNQAMRKALEKIRDREGPGLDGSPPSILYDVAVSALSVQTEKRVEGGQKCGWCDLPIESEAHLEECSKRKHETPPPPGVERDLGPSLSGGAAPVNFPTAKRKCEVVLPLLMGRTTICGNVLPCNMHG